MLLLASSFAFAQDNYLWPIQGKNQGSRLQNEVPSNVPCRLTPSSWSKPIPACL
jgi:hypothetical protein